MKIRDILRSKGSDVICVGPDQPVQAAVKVLSEHRIGALVVTTGDEIHGIISERDVLNLVARDPDAVRSAPVREVMTADLIVCVPEDDVDYAMNIMTQNRIRHLPVIQDDRLAGMLSIGDVVNTLRKTMESENRHLKDYIHGVAG